MPYKRLKGIDQLNMHDENGEAYSAIPPEDGVYIKTPTRKNPDFKYNEQKENKEPWVKLFCEEAVRFCKWVGTGGTGTLFLVLMYMCNSLMPEKNIVVDEHDNPINATGLCQRLNISNANMSLILKKLRQGGVIAYLNYHGKRCIVLSPYLAIHGKTASKEIFKLFDKKPEPPKFTERNIEETIWSDEPDEGE